MGRRNELWNKATGIRHVSGVSLNGGLIERSLYEAVNVKHECKCDPMMLELPESWDTLQKRAALSGRDKSKRKKSVVLNKTE